MHRKPIPQFDSQLTDEFFWPNISPPLDISGTQMKTQSKISVQELALLLQQEDIELIDVRTPVEFADAHAIGARNLPLTTLDPTAIRDPESSSERPVYVMCASGNRSRKACQQLRDAGLEHVVDVSGGLAAWESGNLPVARGKKSISLERQVRIAAGLLVVLGVALGYVVHPGFLGLSAFVGAGLVFAGVTNTCGMGMLLARMPWNQVKEASCSV